MLVLIDNDNVFDLLFYGGDNMVAARGEEGLNYSDVSRKVLGEWADTGYVSSMVEIDFDNDGDFDLFLTRADHPFEGKTYVDPENDRFAFFARREKFLYEDLEPAPLCGRQDRGVTLRAGHGARRHVPF